MTTFASSLRLPSLSPSRFDMSRLMLIFWITVITYTKFGKLYLRVIYFGNESIIRMQKKLESQLFLYYQDTEKKKLSY